MQANNLQRLLLRNSMITLSNVDTLNVVKRLVEAGLTREQAEEIADLLRAAGAVSRVDLVGKGELDALRAAIDGKLDARCTSECQVAVAHHAIRLVDRKMDTLLARQRYALIGIGLILVMNASVWIFADGYRATVHFMETLGLG